MEFYSWQNVYIKVECEIFTKLFSIIHNIRIDRQIHFRDEETEEMRVMSFV